MGKSQRDRKIRAEAKAFRNISPDDVKDLSVDQIRTWLTGIITEYLGNSYGFENKLKKFVAPGTSDYEVVAAMGQVVADRHGAEGLKILVDELASTFSLAPGFDLAVASLIAVFQSNVKVKAEPKIIIAKH